MAVRSRLVDPTVRLGVAEVGTNLLIRSFDWDLSNRWMRYLRMPDTWITDLRHYVNECGELPEALPGPALKLALFVGSIAAWMTATACLDGRTSRTNVICRRSPRRRPCPGEIVASAGTSAEGIFWECPLCGDRGRISGWEGTLWDRRAPDA